MNTTILHDQKCKVIVGLKCWIKETSPAILQTTFKSLLKDSGLMVLGYMEHNFFPDGFTCIWLLSESHLAIHTFPEMGKAYIELTCCNESKMKLFDSLLSNSYENVEYI